MVPQKMLESSIKKKKMRMTTRILTPTNISLKTIMPVHKLTDRVQTKMIVFKKVPLAVLLAKVINKMTARKVWEWVWVIDKEVVTMLKMKVEVLMFFPRVVAQLIRCKSKHITAINKEHSQINLILRTI
jgi:hypothetical protein